ncbi:MAG TPA: dihydrofolate reductase family protein [Polyangiaceae bacterium]
MARHAQARVLADPRAGRLERHGRARRRGRRRAEAQGATRRRSVPGGADLAAAFMRHDLVDEFRLYIHPIVLGRGKPLFRAADAPLNLRLLETRAFGSGVVLVRYERTR